MPGRIGLVIGAIGLMSACAQTGESPGGEANGYLSEVKAAEEDWRGAFGRMEEILTATYNTRGAFFSALEQAEFTEASDRVLAQAEELDPPERFEEDHEAWLGYRRALDSLEGFHEAVVERDLLAVLRVITSAAQAEAEFFSDLSPQFCRAVVGDVSTEDWRCPPEGELPGGDYGEQVYEILRRHALKTDVLFIFPADMTPEERSTRLSEVQPTIEEELHSAGRQLEALDPPTEFESDHQALLRFFRDQHETAVAITEANAHGDEGRLQELFDRSGVVYETMEASLSDGIARVVRPLVR